MTPERYQALLDAAWAEHLAPRAADAPTVISTFAGCGGSSLGYSMAGYRELAAVEWAENPGKAFRLNFPDVPLWQEDIKDLSAGALMEMAGVRPGELDVLDGSPPCFHGDVLITSVKGQVPISEVQVGDLVLTHRGRWRPVVRVGSKTAGTVVVKGQGHHGLVTTANHPIYSRLRMRSGWTEPDWVAAGEMKGRFWAVPAVSDPLPVPSVPGRGAEFTPEFWWMVGRWLGDGWVRLRGRRLQDVTLGPPKKKEPLRSYPAPCVQCGKPARRHARYLAKATAYCSELCDIRGGRARQKVRGVTVGDSALICCAVAEAEPLGLRLNAVATATGRRSGRGELRWRGNRERTTWRFECHHNGLADWLVEHFGRGADAKRVPSWAFGMPVEWRRSLLEGLLSADGYEKEAGRKRILTTISWPLVVSVRMLAEGLGMTTTIDRCDLPPRSMIQGRDVAQAGFWQLGVRPGATKHVLREQEHTWGLVRRVTPGERVVVHDLEVEEDHSYVADGVVVHNCQGFSTAGRRQLHDSRNSLFREYARLLEALRPRAFVMENVSGMVRSHMRVVFAEIMRTLKACGYRVRCWLMDVRWYGVPQARKRVILIGLRDDLGVEPTMPAPLGPEIPLCCAHRSFMPGAPSEPEEVPTPELDERSRKLWTLVRPGEALADVRERMTGARRGFQDVYKVNPRRPSPTMTALSTGRGYATLCHPFVPRSLTIGEARVICSFPRRFQLVGDFSQRWALIGNSVPPLFMRAVSSHVRGLIGARQALEAVT